MTTLWASKPGTSVATIASVGDRRQDGRKSRTCATAGTTTMKFMSTHLRRFLSGAATVNLLPPPLRAFRFVSRYPAAGPRGNYADWLLVGHDFTTAMQNELRQLHVAEDEIKTFDRDLAGMIFHSVEDDQLELWPRSKAQHVVCR